MRLALIRHASVRQEPKVPTRSWHLAQEGRNAADRLRHHDALRDVDIFYCGDEIKMRETGAILAGQKPVFADAAFSELNRDAAGWLSDGDYVALVYDILLNPQQEVHGCESAKSVLQRWKARMSDLQKTEEKRPIAIVSGGLALTIYVSSLQGRTYPDTAMWNRMRFPDLAVVDLADIASLTLFGSEPR